MNDRDKDLLTKTLFACAFDREFRAAFISEPRLILDKLGIKFAMGKSLKIIESEDDSAELFEGDDGTVMIPIPALVNEKDR